MCVVTAIAGATALNLAIDSLIVTTATAVTGFAAQKSQAEAQQERYEQNAKNARNAVMQEYRDIGLRMQQEESAASAKKLQTQREARKLAATARVGALDAGVGGPTVDLLLGDIDAQAAQFNNRVDQNLGYTLGHLQRSKDTSANTGISQINSMSPGFDPSLLDPVLRIGSGALGAAGGYYDRKAQGYK